MSEELNSIETQAQNLISKHPKNGGEIFFLTFRQLNCLAVMVILGASGMVSLEDFGILVFSAIYMWFLSKFAFPLNEAQQKPVFDPDSKILGFYLLFTAVIGLFLPIFYIFYGMIGGEKDEIKAAVPHVFLLTSQVFMEGFTVLDCFSLPIRVFIPVFFNSYRLIPLKEWVMEEMVKEKYGGSYSYAMLYFGRAIAVANLVLWYYNLFGFLLPVYLPRVFKKYYSGND